MLSITALIAIPLCALLFGVFWGPWLALSRSMATFSAPVFLAIVARMDHNLGRIMGFIMPVAILSIVPVGIAAAGVGPLNLALAIAAFAAFVVTLLVTMLVEVPIVTRIRDWTPDALPPDWQTQRDRWVSFHLIRVLGGFAGLVFLTLAALL
ncbi:anthrone oxygenase family protein [Subtercola endophyticus]|uniref:anthrone oxygenase family protein n=1 Tax=Subtercola endophyticus TaxID=2895559 RepID=UPI001E333A86|nr:anthrone oxygenase family protein [Subtercola endophyticus]UFS59024.1 DUF1772 domain-containing protein [Subtercola endophyticus]